VAAEHSKYLVEIALGFLFIGRGQLRRSSVERAAQITRQPERGCSARGLQGSKIGLRMMHDFDAIIVELGALVVAPPRIGYDLGDQAIRRSGRYSSGVAT
jgi:hypothetical protein